MLVSPLQRTRRWLRARGDGGNVLPFTLIFLVVTSLIVMALLMFAITLFRNRPPLEERSDSLEAVRSATRMAITMQRSHGPNGCYRSSTGTFQINGRDVSVTCTVLDNLDDTGGRYSLISTSNTGLSSRDDNSIAASGSDKNIRGSVFVSGGNLGDNTAPMQLSEGNLSAAAPSAYTTDDFKYTTLPTNTDLVVPAGNSCATYYGPNAISTSFIAVEFGTIKGQVETTVTGGGNMAVDVKRRTETTELLGVIVHASDGAVVLDRDRRSNHSFRVAAADAASSVVEVEVCSQPASAGLANFIPRDRTFCGSPLMQPSEFSQPSGETLTCDAVNWWDLAGWKANATASYNYPMLPQIPTYLRSPSPVRVGSSNCYVFYPGRYTSAIDLNGNDQYYFASGVYLFENEVRIRNGAQVVGGEGAWDGCTFDAEASFLPGSPRNHEITGKGVTFLLGSSSGGSVTNGHIEVDNASLRLNNRIATTSTRASAGISIMTVNDATSPGADTVIPSNDRVLLPGCLQSEVAANPACAADIATYSITPIQGGSALSYDASQLTGSDYAVEASLDGSNVETNRLLLAGAVFTPNSGVKVGRTAANNANAYQVTLTGGVTASTIEFDFASGDSTNFFVGEDASSVYQRVELQAHTEFDERDFVSTVQLEVDNAERYAINSWTVGTDQNTPAVATSTASTTTTTLPGTPLPDPWLTEVDRSNPLAHWRLGESGSATTAVDRIGLQNGVYSGSPSPSLGESSLIGGDSDTSAGFAGGNSASRVAIPSHNSINRRSVATRTIELFFNASGTGSRQVLFEEGGKTNGFNVYLSGSTLYSQAWSSDWDNHLRTSTSFSPGQTYHVIAVLDAVTDRNLVLYVNGVAVSTDTKGDNKQLRQHSDAIGIGAREGGTKFHDGNSSGSEQNEFTGFIDDVVLYDSALDASTVATHYNAATSTPVPTPSSTTSTTSTTSSTTTSSTSTTTTSTTTTTTVPAPNTGVTHPTITGAGGTPIGNHPEEDYCAASQNSWTHDFGDGLWLAEYWNFTSSMNTGNYGQNIFVGNPDSHEYVSEINPSWGSNGGPAGQHNRFGARYTATLNVPSNCTMQLQVSGDDGYALYVNGSRVLAHWSRHSTSDRDDSVTLQAGENLVVVEYYEWSGNAVIELEWKN